MIPCIPCKYRNNVDTKVILKYVKDLKFPRSLKPGKRISIEVPEKALEDNNRPKSLFIELKAFRFLILIVDEPQHSLKKTELYNHGIIGY